MSHHTDIADGWEREGEDYEFFYRFSVDAYELGINSVVARDEPLSYPL